MVEALLPDGARCSLHPATPAVALCSRCGDFICGVCTEPRQNLMFCRRCAPEELFRSTPSIRVLAHLCDVLLLFLPIVVLGWLGSLVTNEWFGYGGLLGFVFVVGAQCFTLHQSAQSLGKLACGIRLARPDGTAPSVARIILLRNVVPIVIQYVPAVGQLFGIADGLMLFFSDDRRCLHDRIADTIVVDTRERMRKTFGQ